MFGEYLGAGVLTGRVGTLVGVCVSYSPSIVYMMRGELSRRHGGLRAKNSELTRDGSLEARSSRLMLPKPALGTTFRWTSRISGLK